MENGSAEHGYTWLFVYGPALPINLLVSIVGGPLPAKYYPAVVHDAWLSFDVRGVPYFEPARSSLLIRGVNDQAAPVPGEKDDGRLPNEAYQRWLYRRTAPGRDFERKLPPDIEGIVYQVTAPQLLAWQVYHATFGHISLKTSPRLVPLTVHPFADADPGKRPEAVPDSFVAHTLVAPDGVRAPDLQPAFMTFVMHFQAFTMPCSREYGASLTDKRPYRAERRLGRAITALCLSPAFLVCYVPFALLKRPIPYWPAFVLELAIAASWRLERWIAPFCGSGCSDH